MRRWRGCSIASVIGLLLAPATAWAQSFPADPQWIALTQNQVVITDPTADAQNARDIVGDDASPTAYIHGDGTYLYFRLRVDADPLQSAPTNYRPFGWACLMDTDGNLQSYELVAGVDGIANPDIVDFRQNTSPTNVGDASDDAETQLASYPPITHARSLPAPSNFNGTPDFFIDWAINVSDLAAAGVTAQTQLRFICGTSNNARSLVADLISATGATTLPDLASDPIVCGPTGCTPYCNGLGQACSTGQQGVCGVGTITCDTGEPQCTPNAAPSAEVCDGLDNNCDGSTDESNPGGGVACTSGLPGVCAAGTTACTGGSLQCIPDVGPSSETCDSLDNNCDGTVDDGFNVGATCTEGVGACQATGVFVCDGSGGATCNATPGSPSAEVCDGLDNNCDGSTDEGNPGSGVACSTGLQGVCAAGTTTCSGGAIQCTPNVAPSAETCDGVDNDCDGAADDGFNVGATCTNGVGACQATGTIVCDGAGAATCNAVPGSPSAEVCDGVDNNCDGSTDEGNPGGGVACSSGLPGVCAAGTTTCSGGAIQCTPDTAPSAETCDGLDNDCDGTNDDGFNVGMPCTEGVGACMDTGTIICDGAGAATCDATPGSPSAEICGDGVDNNCDGTTDEQCADTDGDGLTDAVEEQLGTDPNDADSDNDGVPDGEEPQPGVDSDGDGLINALDPDSDDDGLFDGTELGYGCSGPGTDASLGHCIPDGDGGATTTDPLDADTDDGGVPDGSEDTDRDGVVDAGETDPTAGNGDDDGSNQDSDGDGLSDGLEETIGTDPNDADTDNDGVPDGQEPNPADDTDGDGLINALDPDSDNDGLFDGTEMGFDCSGPGTDASVGHCTPDGDMGATTTNPLDADTDDGGVSDGSEDADLDGAIDAGETDPTAGNGADDTQNPDSDGDGLSDDLEGTLGTDPNDADTDDDGVLDGQEANPSDDHDGDGTINALDEDADGDGLFDGTELGLDCSNPDTDPAAGNCVPDADGGATTTNPLDADTDDGGVSDGDEDANHNGAVDAGETDPTAGNGADDMTATGCTDDSECGDPTSGMVCDDATQTCVPGCRGEGGNGCPNGEVCSSTDESIGTCGPPPPECTVDAECGGATSGQVCDPVSLACVQGCRGADGNSCPTGLECSSTDDAIGTCFTPEGVFVEGNGCVCAARPSQGSGAAWLALPAALALLGARRRRRSRR